MNSFLVDCADPTCSGRGKCLHGECHCTRGWTGTSCEKKEVLQVHLNKNVKGNIK